MGIMVSVDHQEQVIDREQEADQYFLRGLLYCGDRLLVPTYAEGTRYYRCPDPTCARQLVPAEHVEQLVWTRYGQLNREAAEAVTRHQRHAALVEVLARVTLGERLTALDYGWRD